MLLWFSWAKALLTPSSAKGDNHVSLIWIRSLADIYYYTDKIRQWAGTTPRDNLALKQMAGQDSTVYLDTLSRFCKIQRIKLNKLGRQTVGRKKSAGSRQSMQKPCVLALSRLSKRKLLIALISLQSKSLISASAVGHHWELLYKRAHSYCELGM